MTPAELKAAVEAAGHEPHFFTRQTMRFFGDTMRNYGVRAKPVEVTRYDGSKATCWELYRKRPVKHGLCASAYFECGTFQRVLTPSEGR